LSCASITFRVGIQIFAANLSLCIHHIWCWNPDLCYSLSCASITVCVGIQIFAANFSASSFVFVLELRLQQLQCIIICVGI
jgi:hypothetical protein